MLLSFEPFLSNHVDNIGVPNRGISNIIVKPQETQPGLVEIENCGIPVEPRTLPADVHSAGWLILAYRPFVILSKVYYLRLFLEGNRGIKPGPWNRNACIILSLVCFCLPLETYGILLSSIPTIFYGIRIYED